MSKRSDLMTKGPERAPHRSLLRAEGFTDWEMDRPMIGIANSFNEIIPGHMHLDKLVEAVKAGIYAAGGTPVVFAERVWLAKQTGYKAVELVNAGIKPRDIMTQDAFYNTIAADMALGGSTNTALHIPAIAYYTEVDITLKDFGKVSKKIPHLTSIAPAGPHHVVDFFMPVGYRPL